MLDVLKGILREDEIAELECQEELKSLERERDTHLDELDRQVIQLVISRKHQILQLIY